MTNDGHGCPVCSALSVLNWGNPLSEIFGTELCLLTAALFIFLFRSCRQTLLQSSLSEVGENDSLVL